MTDDHAYNQRDHFRQTHLVERFIPNACRKTPQPTLPLLPQTQPLINSHQLRPSLFISLPLRILLIHQIHLIHQYPHPSICTILPQSFEYIVKVSSVVLPFSGSYVEDVDQDGDVGEDGVFLGVEVIVDEGVLATAVPEVLRQSEDTFGNA